MIRWPMMIMIAAALRAYGGELLSHPDPVRAAEHRCTAGDSAAVPDAVSPDLRLGPHNAVVNGVRLWYCVAGSATSMAPPVVFLHGGPGEGSQSFATLAGPALERSLRMVYLDQRGSGRSERPWNKAYSVALLVDDLEKLRRVWGVPRIALIGHSVGTIVAMEYGAKYPEHVYAMVLSAAGPDLPATFNIQCDRLAQANPGVYARAAAAAVAGSGLKCNVYADHVFEGDALQAFVNGNMFPDPGTERLINRADNAGGLRNTGELSNALINAGILSYRFREPGRLTMPVLVIAGREDHQANIEPQRTFAATLPNGRFLEYPGAGHFMWAEQPQRFASDVIAFLRAGNRRAGK
jgi:proline iminopeptidase